MTRLLLTLMASAAISGTALAQQYQQTPSKPPAQDQSKQPSTRQGQTQPPSARPGQQPGQTAQERISPRRLKTDQVRMLQQALSDKGMKLGVDGRWGPRSDSALRAFQKQQGMQPSGMLDKPTAAALGAPIPGEGEGPPPSNVSPGAPPSGQQPPQDQKDQPQRMPEGPQSPPSAPNTNPQ